MADEARGIDPHAMSRLRRLGGADLVDRMIAIFLENAPKRMERARKAAQAGDAQGVERATHSLKSMAANIGALRLYALAEAVEIEAAGGVRDHLVERMQGVAEELELVRMALADWREDGT